MILDIDSEFFSLKVVCSKGTYIRTLIADIGDRIGYGCYVSKLERTGVSNLTLGNSVSLSKMQSLNMNERLKLVKPVDSLLSQYPKINFDVEYTEKVRQGKDFLIKGCFTKKLLLLFVILESSSLFSALYILNTYINRLVSWIKYNNSTSH